MWPKLLLSTVHLLVGQVYTLMQSARCTNSHLCVKTSHCSSPLFIISASSLERDLQYLYL